MANEEQLSILKQGVEVWNKWRDENPDARIDLKQADLRKANLAGANLREIILRRANLSRAVLNEAVFRQADLSGATFSQAELHNTDMSRTKLAGANLTSADLKMSNLTNASLGGTIFGNSDLSEITGLDMVHHIGPSEISTSVLTRSKGKIPEVFLRGCGLSDVDIEYAKLSSPDLSNEEINKILYRIYDLRATQALQISPLFISYSHADSAFVDQLEYRLNKKGIRFWRDIHDMTAGRIEEQIDKAISQNRTVLLILSKHSLKSDWVEHEVRKAREIATNAGRDTLCPVALDDSWKKSPWPARVMEQIMEYNILDFSAWDDDRKFGDMFRRLIDGLELFYKG